MRVDGAGYAWQPDACKVAREISPIVRIARGCAERDVSIAEKDHSSRLTPAGAAERIEVIDAVRGFALFGVLLANLVWLSQEIAVTPAQIEALPTAAVDRLVRAAVQFFVDWKFYTLFAFLFGLGFSVQLTRGERRGVSVLPAYLRRLGVLFAFGLVHAYLVWYGDILHHYAILGVLLILFRKRSDRFVLGMGILLGVVVPAVVVMRAGLGAPPPPPIPTPPDPEIAARFRAFASGSYVDLVRENAAFSFGFWTSGFARQFLPAVFGRFLVGLYAGRRRLLEEPERHVALFRKLLVWGLVFGLAGNGLWVLTTRLIDARIVARSAFWVLAAQLPIYVGIVAMAAFYLSAIVLLWRVPAWRARLARLAPVGRMALTNYLTHSLIYVWVFYGFGLTLLGRVGATFCLGLSVVIFAGQVLVSTWWLRRFEYGPAEWLWRSLTYATRQPMRLPAPGSATGA